MGITLTPKQLLAHTSFFADLMKLHQKFQEGEFMVNKVLVFRSVQESGQARSYNKPCCCFFTFFLILKGQASSSCLWSVDLKKECAGQALKMETSVQIKYEPDV